jgi:hypothetical protein
MMLLLLACADYNGPLSLDPLWVGTTAPNRGHVVAELVDSEGRPVADWTPDELTLEVDGNEVDATFGGWADRDVGERTIILLDLSDGADIGALKAAARMVIEQVDGEIALVGYASELEIYRNLTNDKDALRLALDEVGILGATTDTNQALLDVFGLWEEELDPATGGVRGAVLLISDGGTGPDAVGDGEVKEAADGRPIITIGIGENLSGLATHGSFRARDADALPDTVTEALDYLFASREGLLHVTWCGSGDQAELTFNRGRLKGSLLENLNGTGLGDSAPWGQVTDLPEPIQSHHARVVGDHLYIGGGDWEGNIFYARVLETGLLGQFREGSPVPDPGSETRFGSWNNQLVAINGDKAWVLPLADDGSPGEWEDLESPLYANVIREHEGTLYSVSRQHVYRYDGDGWTQSAEVPDGGLDGYIGATVSEGNMVVVGGWRGSPNDPWQTRAFSMPLSSMDAWTELPPLPHYMGFFMTADGDGTDVLVFPGADADALDILTFDGSDWVTAGAVALGRDYYSTAVAPDGTLYLHGGKVEGEKTTTGYLSRLDQGELALTCP